MMHSPAHHSVPCMPTYIEAGVSRGARTWEGAQREAAVRSWAAGAAPLRQEAATALQPRGTAALEGMSCRQGAS
jgi:hypothetical protein